MLPRASRIDARGLCRPAPSSNSPDHYLLCVGPELKAVSSSTACGSSCSAPTTCAADHLLPSSSVRRYLSRLRFLWVHFHSGVLQKRGKPGEAVTLCAGPGDGSSDRSTLIGTNGGSRRWPPGGRRR